MEPPEDEEGWRHFRLQQAGKNASGQTHYLSVSGLEIYGTVIGAVEEPLGIDNFSIMSINKKIICRSYSGMV